MDYNKTDESFWCLAKYQAEQADKPKKKKKHKPSDDISPEKAEEMLENPPHGQPLSEKQERMLHAAASK